jgi:hypothetical protein
VPEERDPWDGIDPAERFPIGPNPFRVEDYASREAQWLAARAYMASRREAAYARAQACREVVYARMRGEGA